MFLLLNKKILQFIVIWFAIMQIISPLMHAHIGKDSPIQGSGMHMHIVEIQQVNDKVPTIKNSVGSLHSVGVDKALIKKLDLILPSVLAVLVFILFLTLVRQYFKPYTNSLILIPSSLRPDSRPRAPPLF